MTRSALLLSLLVTLISVGSAQTVLANHATLHTKFALANGDLIELDTQAGTLLTPRSRDARLEDCSDRLQVCLTDHHGFAFAYFRKCADAGLGEYRRLRYTPKVVSVLHDDVWFVYDASPKYLFHYAYGNGIVGIYLARTPVTDFRNVLRDRKFKLSDLSAMEYKKTSSSDVLAACSK